MSGGSALNLTQGQRPKFHLLDIIDIPSTVLYLILSHPSRSSLRHAQRKSWLPFVFAPH